MKADQKKPSPKKAGAKAGADLALDNRYRKIGISAVAAAVRYQSDRRNADYAAAPRPVRSVLSLTTKGAVA